MKESKTTQYNTPNSIIKVSLWLIFFLCIYTIVLAGSFSLGAYLVYLAFTLIAEHFNLLTLLISFGLLGLSVILLLFTIRHFKKHNKIENDQNIKIQPDKHPKLFAIINKISDSLKIRPPHTIYLIPDSNAGVFFKEQSIFPFTSNPKELMIGGALINSLNEKELEAVIAHELAHFSQKEMMLGKMVTSANQYIFHIVHDQNNFIDKAIKKHIDKVFFGSLIVILKFLMNQERKIFNNIYNSLNKEYNILARDLEFKADNIATRITDTDTMISALRRIEFGHLAYNLSRTGIDELTEAYCKVSNIYEYQSEMTSLLIDKNNLSFDNLKLPIITNDYFENRGSRIIFEDPMSTHPMLSEREMNILDVNSKNKSDKKASLNPAWMLFSNELELQKLLTEIYYASQYPDIHDLRAINSQEFHQWINKDKDMNDKLNSFHGFFSDRKLEKIDIWGSLAYVDDFDLKFDQIFNADNQKEFKRYRQNLKDLKKLYWIKNSYKSICNFKFDNVVFHSNQADEIIGILEEEIHDGHKKMKKLEEQAFLYSFKQSMQFGMEDQLIEKYLTYYALDKESDRYISIQNRLESALEMMAYNDEMDDSERMEINQEIVEINTIFRMALNNSKDVAINTDFVAKRMAEKNYSKFINEGLNETDISITFKAKDTEQLIENINNTSLKVQELNELAFQDLITYLNDLNIKEKVKEIENK
ncbi:M48 family metalloprotease [Aureibacter tunicatorum]|uniref:Zn-dependent protease with chaperone function n=1 Tax=Aureibacter tunicatorum TaxID=866807 RepID=A0AAE3XLV5_9BACT|nr:M48 family metalloprotease [Aureibacter tunicatorum]MDR6238335.1 Zn-dependent protease with chaperone function [Aureibacter tunicatorum]BDD03367.1 hypothetical protein AUTU_08500 [Aureibacter tunicatorum]